METDPVSPPTWGGYGDEMDFILIVERKALRLILSFIHSFIHQTSFYSFTLTTRVFWASTVSQVPLRHHSKSKMQSLFWEDAKCVRMTRAELARTVMKLKLAWRGGAKWGGSPESRKSSLIQRVKTWRVEGTGRTKGGPDFLAEKWWVLIVWATKTLHSQHVG